VNAIELNIFVSRLNAVCDEMGAVLQRAAFSPNIRDRLDYSCAVFDAQGELSAQAAHIPVHLGSMAYAMRDIVTGLDWRHGDMVIVNDPYLGGTHLPDVTLIAPVFHDEKLLGFVANRAHHADIGSETPGSMPLSSSLEEEGIIISPIHLIEAGTLNAEVMGRITAAIRSGNAGQGDFAAQVSANRSGLLRIGELIKAMGATAFSEALADLNDYAERLARSTLSQIPEGEYRFSDVLDDDGLGNTDLTIQATLQVEQQQVRVDFNGTSQQVTGNVNCPLSVAAAAVYYVFRCLMPPQTPACAGSFRPISINAPVGCLLNAQYPAAVAAGNVETSTRVVDVVMGALARAMPNQIPAASHGSMNNLAMGRLAGKDSWDYYETIGGGMGAGPVCDGTSAVQTHMTNTLNTPIEVLESNYPLRVTSYAVRDNSGGRGRHSGGDGLVRSFTFLQPATVTLLTERRRHSPWGLQGGEAGLPGRNLLNGIPLASKATLNVQSGDTLQIETAGGGGWGITSHEGRVARDK
jgi:N-methylhydantoinase B